jgi:hypothetical protein
MEILGELSDLARRLAQHGLGVLPDLAARDQLARPGPGLALDLLLAPPFAVIVTVVMVMVMRVVVRLVLVIVFRGGHLRAFY